MTNHVIVDLFAAGGQNIAQADLKLANELESWLAQTHGGVLAALDPAATQTSIQEDITSIPAELLRGSLPTPIASRMIGILANAIDQANRLYQKTLPLPPISQVRRRRQSPWLSTMLLSNQHADHLVASLKELLKAGIPAASSPYGHLGLVIPSSILFGGVLHQDSLAALIRACVNPSVSWSYFGRRLQLELRIAWRRQANAERRLWFPDALTALLLMRFQAEVQREAQSGLTALNQSGKDSDSLVCRWLWTEVMGPYRDAARRRGAVEKSLFQLLATVACRYRMVIPELMVAYMTREILSTSLPRHVLARVHGISIEAGPEPPPSTTEPAEVNEIDREPGAQKRNLEIIEADWFDEIRSALRQKAIGAIRSQLRALASKFEPGPARRFAEFGAYLLSERSAGGRRLHMSTAKAYTRILLAKLGPTLDGTDPIKRPPSELLGDYVDVLEQASDGGRRKSLRLTLARAIHEFHVFLARKYEIEPIKPADLGLGRASAAAVDANLITEAEYRRTAASIRNYTGAPDDATIVPGALLLLQIAYRAGIRRDEARNLQWKDFLLAEPGRPQTAEILIRPSGTHELKSANAIRRLPIGLLFKKEENLNLEHWIDLKRGLSDDNPETRIFDSTSRPGSSSFHRIVSLVVSAMRAVTGDSRLRFHHLRHSAVSTLFSRLMFHNAGIAPSRWPAQLLASDATSTSELHRALTDSPGATRKLLFSVALQTGHSDPATDCSFYCHTFDGLQATLLDKSVLAPGKDLLVEATDLGHTQAYQTLGKDGAWALANRHAPSPWPDPASIVPPGAMPDSSCPSWLDRLYSFLIQSERRSSDSVEDLAPDHEFDPLAGLRMIERARCVRAMQTSNHTLKFAMENQKHPEVKRLYTPRRPHLLANLQLAETLSTGVEKALQSFRDESIEAIEMWLEGVKLDETQIIVKKFEHASIAAAFSVFLERAGIGFQWFRFDQDPDSDWVLRWRIYLGLDASIPIPFRRSPPHAPSAALQWIAIEPSFPSMPAKGNKGGTNGKEAFQFVMTMAAIYAESFRGPRLIAGAV